MPNYRRAAYPGGTHFFTVNTFRRQPALTDWPFRVALRHVIRVTQPGQDRILMMHKEGSFI